MREAIVEALRQVEGAYSLVFCTKKELIAARDPHGVRLLVFANPGVASDRLETCALDLLGAKYALDIKPGELLYVNGGGVEVDDFLREQNATRTAASKIFTSRGRLCLLFGKSPYMMRTELGVSWRAKPRPKPIWPGLP